jgi:hypothetical protein
MVLKSLLKPSRALLPFAAVLGALAGSPAAAQPPGAPRVAIKVVESQDAPTPPRGLVVCLIDRSGSMDGEVRAGASQKRWEAAISDLLSRPLASAMKAAGRGGMDVRLYPFSDVEAVYSRPAGRVFRVDDGGDFDPLRQFISDRSTAGLGSPGGQTALYGSVRSVLEGLASERALDRYGWVYVVIYSDGEDNRSQGDRPGMCEALELATRDPRVIVEQVIIGNVSSLGCGVITVNDMGKVSSGPKIFNTVVDPGLVELPRVPKAADLAVRVETQLPAEMRGRSAAFRLVGAPAGVSLVDTSLPDASGDLRLRFDRALESGAQFAVTSRIQTPGNQSLDVSFRVVVPALQKLPPASAWGLPEGCGGKGASRLVIVARGQPADLKVVVPGAQANWTWGSAPDQSFQGPTLPVETWAPGTYDVTVSLSSDDGRTSSPERLQVCVVDPAVTVRVDPARPMAGESFTLTAELSKDLPAAVRDRVSSAATWFVAGGMVKGAKGLSCDAPPILRKGADAAEFVAVLECGAQRITFRGAADVDVQAGPFVRIVTDRVTRGKDAEIEIDVQESAMTSAVVVRVCDPRADPAQPRAEVRAVPQPGKSADGSERPWVARFKSSDLELAAESLGDEMVVLVDAMPVILEGSTGQATAQGDPRNVNRRVAQKVVVGKPDVRLSGFLGPAAGAEPIVGGAALNLDDEHEVSVMPGGRDPDLVAAVGMQVFFDGVLDAAQSGDMSPVAAEGGVVRAAPEFRRKFRAPKSGSAVRIEFVARDPGGNPLGEAIVHDLALVPGPNLLLWVLAICAFLMASYCLLRCTHGNSRLGQAYVWSEDSDGQVRFEEDVTVKLSGGVRLDLWSKTMTVVVPVDNLPPEGKYAWLHRKRAEFPDGEIRFTIDRSDNVQGDRVPLRVDTIGFEIDKGFVLLPPAPPPGERPGQQVVLTFYHQPGGMLRLVVQLTGWLLVVGMAVLLAWLYVNRVF